MTTQGDSVCFCLTISGIDGESLLKREPNFKLCFVPSHEHPKLVEINSNIGLLHCQPSAIQALLSCAPLDEKDLDSCIMFEEEIIFEMPADDDLGVASDEILIEDEVCIPFGSQLFPHHDDHVLQSSESHPPFHLVDNKRCPVMLSACFNHSPKLPYHQSELVHHLDLLQSNPALYKVVGSKFQGVHSFQSICHPQHAILPIHGELKSIHVMPKDYTTTLTHFNAGCFTFTVDTFVQCLASTPGRMSPGFFLTRICLQVNPTCICSTGCILKTPWESCLIAILSILERRQSTHQLRLMESLNLKTAYWQ